ncbi:hypothetical protein A5888_003065 [Enterococcus sp. 9E7_DIV0242]|uniref:DUF5648 domain-containing protein n=2 Tax=Candidatus Enterococcus clewellii TaxID=1834193 RepID=A0AAQ3XZI4_9ENTE
MNRTEVTTLQNRGWANEGIVFRAYTSQWLGLRRAVFRLYHEGARKHYLTGGVSERDALMRSGWRYEGITFYVDRIINI